MKVFNEIHTVLFIFCRLSSSAIWRPVFKTTSSSITKNLNSFFSRTIESFDKWFSPIDPQTACAHSKCKQCFMQISFRAKALGGGISDPKKSYSQMNTKNKIRKHTNMTLCELVWWKHSQRFLQVQFFRWGLDCAERGDSLESRSVQGPRKEKQIYVKNSFLGNSIKHCDRYRKFY